MFMNNLENFVKMLKTVLAYNISSRT